MYAHRQRMLVARILVITNYEAIIILVKCVVIIDDWELATFGADAREAIGADISFRGI